MDLASSRRWLSLTALGLSLSLTSSSWAQTDQERAGARAAAKDGIAAFNDGDFEKSLSLLERAEKLVHAPTHLLFIARARVKLGQLVEAREAYKDIINENLSPSAPKAFLNAQEIAPKELAEIEGRLAKLTLSVSSASGELPSDVEVKIDGAVLSATLYGLAVPANPGERSISATASGMLPIEKNVTLKEGGADSLELVFEVDPNAPVAIAPAEEVDAAPAQATAGSEGSEQMSKRDTWGWVSVGTGSAFVATGAALGIVSLTSVNKAENDDSLCGSDNICTEEGTKKVNSAQTMALLADIGIGVGLVGIGVGAYLLLTDGKPKTEVGVHHILPSADKNGGYLTVQGAF